MDPMEKLGLWLLLQTVAVFGGVAAKDLIWEKGRKASSAHDWGVFFLAWATLLAIFICPVQFIRVDFDEALARTLAFILPFLLIAYAAGFLIGLTKKPISAGVDAAAILKSRLDAKLDEVSDANRASSASNLAWSVAYQELETGTFDRGTWAKAYATANGNESQAKALYLKLRVPELSRLEGLLAEHTQSAKVSGRAESGPHSAEKSDDAERHSSVRRTMTSDYAVCINLLKSKNYEVKRRESLTDGESFWIVHQATNEVQWKFKTANELTQFVLKNFSNKPERPVKFQGAFRTTVLEHLEHFRSAIIVWLIIGFLIMLASM